MNEKKILREALQHILDHPRLLYLEGFICTALIEIRPGDYNTRHLFTERYNPYVEKRLMGFTRNKYWVYSNSWWNLTKARRDGNYDKLIQTKLLYIKRVIEIIDEQLTKV